MGPHYSFFTTSLELTFSGFLTRPMGDQSEWKWLNQNGRYGADKSTGLRGEKKDHWTNNLRDLRRFSSVMSNVSNLKKIMF